MKLELRYAAQYRYAERVSFSPHLFRLIPKVDRGLKLRGFDFRTNKGAVVHWRRDLFDNEVASVFYPTPNQTLDVKMRLHLELQPRNPFGFLLASRALYVPFAYEPQEQLVLAPYLRFERGPKLPFWQAPITPHPTVETLVELNQALYRNLAYERREDGPARPPAETLALGRGACRDFALLMVEVLRGLGLAARFASGYLCDLGAQDRRADGALHAWVEVYLPGAGWVGFDPTNGLLCDHHHLTTAVGIHPHDVAPVIGSYYHSATVPHELETRIVFIPKIAATETGQ